MAGKVLSIEVGYSVTRVVEMDYEAKSPKIYNAFSFETPPNVLSDEGISINESMVALMKQGLTENGIKTSRAIFTISSGRIANREVIIPLVKDNKIKQLLIANSKDYFPVDLSQYELVFRVIERLKEQKQLRLSVFAVPHALLDSYKALARAWNLQLVAMDYSGNSVYQAMLKTMDPAFSVTIRVDDRNSMITIVKDGKVELQRTIGYGIDEAVEIVRNCKVLDDNATYIDAVDLMRRITCMDLHLQQGVGHNMEEDDEMVETEIIGIRSEVTRSLTMLLGNLTRVMDYYTSRNTDVTIDRIQLIGLGADCSGLSKLLTNELGIKVVCLQEFKDANLNRSVNKGRFKVAEYMTCIGATYEPLNFMMEAEKKEGASSSGESVALGVIVFVGCLIISLGILGVGFYQYTQAQEENKRLAAELRDKSSIVDVYNEYLEKKVTHDGIVVMDAMTLNTNKYFLELLHQMEQKMPSELLLTSIVSTNDGVSMAFSSMTKEAAAEAIMQLRTIEGIGNITCSEVVQEVDENEVTKHNFEVYVQYNPFTILGDEYVSNNEKPDANGDNGGSSDEDLQNDIDSMN